MLAAFAAGTATMSPSSQARQCEAKHRNHASRAHSTLPAALRARLMPSAQAACEYAADGLARVRSEPRPQRRVVVQAPQRARQRPLVARRHDEAGALVLHEAACGGADGVGGDDGDSLVEGFVDDEPPRLEEVARGDRRHHHNVAAGVEVAQPLGRQGAFEVRRAGGDGPGSDRTVANQYQRG